MFFVSGFKERGEATGHDPGTHEKLCNHYEIVADNSVKYVLPDFESIDTAIASAYELPPYMNRMLR